MTDAADSRDVARVAVIIPAYEPEAALLLPFLDRLRQAGFRELIVIDDGSPAAFAPVFDAALGRGCRVLHHEINRGKGRALKTGFAEAARLPGLEGVVTADADGQHSAEDLSTIARRVLEVSPETAVFGVRNFDGAHVPKNSRRGNKITSKVVQVLFGHTLSDTQTGLRGFPVALAQESAKVKGERFEYEMNVVMWLLGGHHRVVEVPIETIYHDLDNSVSHFRPVADSARIYSMIFRQFGKFVASSLGGAAIDLGVYTLIVNGVYHGRPTGAAIPVATVAARVVSSLANFAMNRGAVFQDRSSPRRAMARYYVLAVGVMLASALGTWAISLALRDHPVWAKVIVDLALFVVSYLVQKRWVFRDDSLVGR